MSVVSALIVLCDGCNGTADHHVTPRTTPRQLGGLDV